MKKIFNKLMITSIGLSLLVIAFGLLLYLKADIANKVVGYIVGSIIIVSGILSIIKYFTNKKQVRIFEFEFVFGILSFLLGIFIIFNPLIITGMIIIILGIWMVISGSIKMQYSLELKRFKEDYWLLPFAVSGLNLIFGILLVFNPFESTFLVTEILGIFMIIYGVLDIIESLIFKKNVKTIETIVIKK